MPFNIIFLVWVVQGYQIVSVFILLGTSLLFKDICAGVEFCVSSFLWALGKHSFGFPFSFEKSTVFLFYFQQFYSDMLRCVCTYSILWVLNLCLDVSLFFLRISSQSSVPSFFTLLRESNYTFVTIYLW